MFDVREVNASDDLQKLVADINCASWDEANAMSRYDTATLTRYLERQDALFVSCYQGAVLFGIASARVQIKPYDDEEWLYVDEIDVCADRRQCGAGTALMQFLLNTAADRGCEEVWLGTESRNHASLALYQSLQPDDIEQVVGFTYETDE